MISTDRMNSYTDNYELNKEILRWINNRILNLLEMYMDLGEDTKWEFEYLCLCFPRNYVEEDISKCLRLLRDLCDILESEYVRKDIKLIYKYVLIKLVEYYQILYEDAEMCGEEDSCNIYFPPVNEQLVKKIYEEYGYCYNGRVDIDTIEEEEEHPEKFIRLGLKDVDGLFGDDVFDELEVDIDMIDEFVNDCIDKIERGEWIKWDLEYYCDVLSRDTKERYYKVKPLINKVQDKMMDIIAGKVVQENIQDELKKPLNKDRLIKDIITACMMLQGNELGLPKAEDARNTYIRNMLRSKGYDATDQTLRGKSASGKQTGELDFEIMDTHEKPFAIYEGMNLNNFNEKGKKYWKNHLEKLLDNYNPMGISLEFLVSYAKTTKEGFNKYWSDYYRYVRNNPLDDYAISMCRDCEQKEAFVRCAEVIYECGGICIMVYHILVRMDN